MGIAVETAATQNDEIRLSLEEIKARLRRLEERFGLEAS